MRAVLEAAQRADGVIEIETGMRIIYAQRVLHVGDDVAKVKPRDGREMAIAIDHIVSVTYAYG